MINKIGRFVGIALLAFVVLTSVYGLGSVLIQDTASQGDIMMVLAYLGVGVILTVYVSVVFANVVNLGDHLTKLVFRLRRHEHLDR